MSVTSYYPLCIETKIVQHVGWFGNNLDEAFPFQPDLHKRTKSLPSSVSRRLIWTIPRLFFSHKLEAPTTVDGSQCKINHTQGSPWRFGTSECTTCTQYWLTSNPRRPFNWTPVDDLMKKLQKETLPRLGMGMSRDLAINGWEAISIQNFGNVLGLD